MHSVRLPPRSSAIHRRLNIQYYFIRTPKILTQYSIRTNMEKETVMKLRDYTYEASVIFSLSTARLRRIIAEKSNG